MSEEFLFDVFLSHSAKDKAVVRGIAERLRGDGLKVWFDEWMLKPGDSIFAKIEEGLERSRVLVLCMSTDAFRSEWAKLEAGTFRFRDPLNRERRFIPLRLDATEVKGALAQFLYVDWHVKGRDSEYAKLLEACRPPPSPPIVLEAEQPVVQSALTVLQLKSDSVNQYAFDRNGRRVLAAPNENKVGLWDIETGARLNAFAGHVIGIWCIAWSHSERFAISGAQDSEIRLWDIETGHCLRVFQGHHETVRSLALSEDERHLLSGSHDGTMRLWDIATGNCIHVFDGHKEWVTAVAWSPDQRRAASASYDKSIRIWDLQSGRCLLVLEGGIWSVAWASKSNLVLAVGVDFSLRLWNTDTGRCLRVLEGHGSVVLAIAFSGDDRYALSGSTDGTVRLWDIETGQCLRVLIGHKREIATVAWSHDGHRGYSGDKGGRICVWDFSELLAKPRMQNAAAPIAPEQVQYTNAKVLLVGESGAGKTGLSKRLALDTWEPSDSTIGAWATQWKLSAASGSGIEREVWLWDFGGQADQRLIHQLYMDETALAVLVFDGQKEDVFESLGQWDRDLTRASRKEFAKVLVAGRVDAGGLRVGRKEIERFASERKFHRFLETSAKTNLGCEELKQAILAGIDWNEIPCRTTELLFKRLKEDIVRLKDEGHVLMRFNELRATLQLRLSGELKQFTDQELRVVLTLLAGPGVVWELSFGSFVLLQPERINAYAQAVIRTLQTDEHQRGCLLEERVLTGDLLYESAMPRLAGEEERFVLLAMHQMLVERGLCLRQPTTQGNLLVFPSYYRTERPDIVAHPAVLVSYRFEGFLDEVYATLIVRLHHTEPFQKNTLWRYAADFKTNTGKQLGVKLNRRAVGAGDLEVYFDPSVTTEEKIIFGKYVHEHLLKHARDVERLRHYVCPHCGTPVGNRDVAMTRLNDWLRDRPAPPGTTGWLVSKKRKKEQPTIICVSCEKRVPLWDEIEQCFASPEILRRVFELQEESDIELSNQSKERALVGDVISTVALANQICREHAVSDHGIDMEIEFTDDAHEATGAKLYLQLKSGDSYLRKRKSDGVEVFTIKDERHVRYWMSQAFPVLLVIRNAEGEVRWMEVRDWLKKASDDGKKPVKQIEFTGERFDVMSVRRWRDAVLRQHDH